MGLGGIISHVTALCCMLAQFQIQYLHSSRFVRYTDGYVQDCSIIIAYVLEILLSCIKPLI